MKKKHLLGVILFFCVVLATIIFALDRMDVISEGVALLLMYHSWHCIGVLQAS